MSLIRCRYCVQVINRSLLRFKGKMDRIAYSVCLFSQIVYKLDITTFQGSQFAAAPTTTTHMFNSGGDQRRALDIYIYFYSYITMKQQLLRKPCYETRSEKGSPHSCLRFFKFTHYNFFSFVIIALETPLSSIHALLKYILLIYLLMSQEKTGKLTPSYFRLL